MIRRLRSSHAKCTISALSLVVGSALALHAATTNSWILESGGYWNDPANWDPTGVPNGAGTLVLLTNSSAASQSVTNDLNITLGGLAIGGPNASFHFTITPDIFGTSWVVDNNGEGALFSNSGAGTQTTGDRVNVPIELADNLTVFSASKGFTLGGVITETGGAKTITKTGSGYLTLLSTANSFSGGIIVKEGQLNAADAGKAGTGPITLGDTQGTATASIIGNGTYTNALVVVAGSTGKKTMRNSATGGTVTFTGPVTLEDQVEINASSSTRYTRVDGEISGNAAVVTTSQAGRQATNYVFLRGANTFTGGVTLQTGNLRVYGHEIYGYSGATALNLTHSLGTGPLTINNNTILSSDGNGNRVITNSVIVNGDFMIGLTNYGAGSIRFAGPVDLGSEMRTIMLGSTVGHYFLGPITGAGGITKRGPLGLSVYGDNNTFQGGFVVAEGTVAYHGDSPFGTGLLTLGDITTAGNVTVTGNGIVPNNILVAVGASGTRSIGCTNFGTATYSGSIALETDLTVGASSSSPRSIILSGSIEGSGGLVVNGLTPTAVSISSSNSYTGTTVVNGGTLFILNTSGSATGSGAVTVGATAVLAGGGALGGPVTLNDGATLAPGVAGIDLLTFDGGLTLSAGSTTLMELDKSLNVADQVAASSVTYGGTLMVSIVGGTIEPGNTFQLFNTTSHSENFSTVLIQGSDLPGEFNPDTGVLTILGGTPDEPPTVAFSVTGQSLWLSWPQTHAGWIVQSNAVDVADSASWFNVPGSDAGTTWNANIDPSASKVFYRLAK
jgi:autotransporter-associated beta strand protein